MHVKYYIILKRGKKKPPYFEMLGLAGGKVTLTCSRDRDNKRAEKMRNKVRPRASICLKGINEPSKTEFGLEPSGRSDWRRIKGYSLCMEGNTPLRMKQVKTWFTNSFWRLQMVPG